MRSVLVLRLLLVRVLAPRTRAPDRPVRLSLIHGSDSRSCELATQADGVPDRVETVQVRTGVDSALDSAVASAPRERIPSLANMLLRCHSTVCGLSKSRAPISGFDSP